MYFPKTPKINSKKALEKDIKVTIEDHPGTDTSEK